MKVNRMKMHKIWSYMKKRCDDSKDPLYKNYGAIGIGYQSSWVGFENFFEDMNTDYPRSVVLERHDKQSDFSIENCYWRDILDRDIRVIDYK